MAKNDITTLLVVCVCIILFASSIKLLFWLQAKKAGSKQNPFLLSYFTWFNVYALWNTSNEKRKLFMQVSNVANVFIWIASVIIIGLLQLK